MSLSEDHKNFLMDMGIKLERFEKLKRDAQILIEIAQDYENHKNDLLDEASYIANKLQRCKGVHTVRSRIKDTSHLVEKIIRKWEATPVSEKYNSISKDNYKSIISDLVGVRAIYLFKNDWEIVHNHILAKWEQQEDVVIYYRNGDDLTKYKDYPDCKNEEHDKGYRSIHYIVPATKIDGQQVNCEIQTRTIFEEGWSEIDHKVRYPSFSDDPYLQEFLDIFNRIAGSADEMGSFVNSLRELIEINNLLEKNRKLSAEVHQLKINELEKEIDQLFKDKAELKEIEAAYNLLKQAQEQKDQAEKKDHIISFEDYQTAREEFQAKINPMTVARLQELLKTPIQTQDPMKASKTLQEILKSSTPLQDLIKATLPAQEMLKITSANSNKVNHSQQSSSLKKKKTDEGDKGEL
ncbi:hypothetical protein [Acinetobacter calcoaceticus]|uniref:hypothetical protein n=1 Tax=Acinetobacter calcoaceticus TaxID=471 RepID=UPI002276A839|nr:hypothetical protein [Acinetobacter calcoaceticus]GLG82193.1 hypothetical protein ACSO1_07150 [Acinetobacter calcoaceticus]